MWDNGAFDFIFQVVLCSPEDVSFNIICLEVLEGINQLHLLMWIKKYLLETPLDGDDVKALLKTSNCDNFGESKAKIWYQ